MNVVEKLLNIPGGISSLGIKFYRRESTQVQAAVFSLALFPHFCIHPHLVLVLIFTEGGCRLGSAAGIHISLSEFMYRL